MDISQMDEEKYILIRQTIRRVILPLVQAIYHEDPSDIISFCSRYFENQLQKRENLENVIEDGHLTCSEAFSCKNEINNYAPESNESNDKEIASSTNIQGSSSEPLLTGDKHCGGLSLRETSSWDMPPSHSKLDKTKNCDLADIMSGIGDQFCLNIKVSADDQETIQKSGDADFTSKDEKEISECCRSQENKIIPTTKSDSTVKAVRGNLVLPSAPPYVTNYPNQQYTQSEFENFEDCTQELITQHQTLTSISENEKHDITSKSLPDAVCNSCSEEHFTIGEDVKTSNKSLSPNSSFGFIPHLNEYNSEEDTRRSYDSSYEIKSPGEIQELAVKFSETLQNLAQKFNSAENNLNVEFEKAKEISDIIQGRCQNESCREDGNLASDLKINNESMVEEKVDETLNDNFDLIFDKNNNVLTGKTSENNFKTECLELTDEAKENASDNKEPDSNIKFNYCSVDENRYVAEERNLTSGKNIKSKILQESELCERQRNAFFHPNYNNNNESRLDNSGSRPVVDESWRKRWYEVHPCLDSVRSFQQTTPRQLRTKRIFTGNRRNLTAHNIGEAGDVPSDRYNISQRYSFQGLRDSSDPNDRIVNTDNSSAVIKCESETNISVEESHKEKNELKVTSNRPDRDFSDSSKNVQCTGEKTNQLVNHLETKDYALKQLLENLGKRNNNSKTRSVCDAGEDMQTSYDQETSPEVIVTKETDQSPKDDLSRNQYTLFNNKKAACESKGHVTHFKVNTYELSPPKIAGVCDTDLTEEKILSDSNDQNLNNEETCSEEYVDAVEVQERSYPKYGEKSNSQVNYHSKKCFEKDFSTASFTNERNKMSVYPKPESCEGTEKPADRKDLSSAIKHEVNTYQRVEDHSKVEPGLNSACGDFTSSSIIANNEEDLNSQQAGRNDSNNYLRNSHYSNVSGVGVQEITTEYVEEVMERLMHQQSTSDCYEGLNFSCYSESESSNVESDFSETDDTPVNNGTGEL